MLLLEENSSGTDMLIVMVTLAAENSLLRVKIEMLPQEGDLCTA